LISLLMRVPAQSEGAPTIQRGELTKVQRYLLIAVCGAILMLYVGGEVAIGVYIYTYARFVTNFEGLCNLRNVCVCVFVCLFVRSFVYLFLFVCLCFHNYEIEISAGLVNTLFWSCFAFGRVGSVFLSAARVGPRTMLW
jgi:fucose permease